MIEYSGIHPQTYHRCVYGICSRVIAILVGQHVSGRASENHAGCHASDIFRLLEKTSERKTKTHVNNINIQAVRACRSYRRHI